MAPKKILIVDDDLDINRTLADYLTLEGFLTTSAYYGTEALKALEKTPDIILLDIAMPEMDGYAFIRRVRAHITCPILFITANTFEEDHIRCLTLGGDDLITKPFSLPALTAKIKAHLRRSDREAHSRRQQVTFSGELAIDYIGRVVTVSEKAIKLTRVEYEIVEFLSLHPAQVFTREMIYENLWGLDALGDSSIVTEHIRRIRQKLGAAEPIETVWGVGYKWIG